MDDLTRLLLGLGMISGVIIIILGLALSFNSYGSTAWFQTGRKISLLGAALTAVSAIIYGVSPSGHLL